MARAPARQKLSAEERRTQILATCVPLFANVGFRGVTTKMLAQQAGVSEALLYQHFASKEALYEAVQDFCCRPPERLKAAIASLTPSTETLVLMHFFIAKIAAEHLSLTDDGDIFPRLMLNSMLEDGTFARLHISRTVSRLANFLIPCYAAARACGDLAPDGLSDQVRFWLSHNVFLGLHLNHLTSPPVVEYAVQGRELAKHVLIYTLRGIGLVPTAIERHCNLERLEATVSAWLASEAKG